MDRATRPLTKKQLDELRGVVAPSTAVVRTVLFVLAGLLVGKLAHALQLLLGGSADAQWWLLPTAGVLIGLYLLAGRWTGGGGLRRRVRRDIAAGQARALRVAAVSALEIDEQEDEGPGFLVETAAGETILFAGQYLERLKRRGFPWREFEVLEAPESGLFLGIRKLGEPLEVRGRRAPLSYRQARDLGVFEKNYVLLDDRGRVILEQGAEEAGR